ncbi:hypothetical protein PHMEG_0007381 [Phytophthora megakarya]|uniref:Helitron helicase n=1 Tax=Phytophthora megakarya TaxID=4795 RepID=A0A225WNT1_9STRA|nr:hypothetical protein PHMEG_0007381 [Phytophthora megakarya]
MLTLSRKNVLLSRLFLAWGNQLRLSADSDASSDDESSDEDVDISYSSLYLVLESRRYITHHQCVDRPPSRINYYLTRMTDDDFRLHFRIPRRVVGALMRLRSDVICWPGLRERREIAERIKQVFELPNCIGLIDGILFPLYQRPIPTATSRPTISVCSAFFVLPLVRSLPRHLS